MSYNEPLEQHLLSFEELTPTQQKEVVGELLLKPISAELLPELSMDAAIPMLQCLLSHLPPEHERRLPGPLSRNARGSCPARQSVRSWLPASS